MMSSLQSLVEELEQDRSLDQPDRFRERIEALDRLDAYRLDAHPLDGQVPPAAELIGPATRDRAEALCSRLEAANSRLCEKIREEIRCGSRPNNLVQYISKSVRGSNTQAGAQGEGYDYLDDLLAGVLRFETPSDARVQLAPEMVPYQPTPAHHIFDLISSTALTEHDVLMDLGSGLGHVPLLVSICTPARAIGIELEATYVNCARQSAQSLNLSNASFFHQDARYADLSEATLFYLYTPFVGTILETMLASLNQEARRRKFRIATFGPCTPIIAQKPWLTSANKPKLDQIAVFTSK